MEPESPIAFFGLMNTTYITLHLKLEVIVYPHSVHFKHSLRGSGYVLLFFWKVIFW